MVTMADLLKLPEPMSRENAGMASADLREELLCSICLTTFFDPVTLTCGHNFCRGCIDHFLNTQVRAQSSFCPECREKFYGRSELKRNINLHNAAIRLLSTQPHQEEVNGICCTYCVEFLVPAVKSCLLCEASLCDKHLRVHSKSPEHVLTDLSTSLENRKCSFHNKILEYYCIEDGVFICVSCCLMEEHQGHKMESLEEKLEKKKKEMGKILQRLATKRETTEQDFQSVENHRHKAEEKGAREAERVTALFMDIRSRLDDLEKRVLREISSQEEQMSLSAPIQQLEIMKDELSRKMRHIEELCNIVDPLTFLCDSEISDLSDSEDGGSDEDTDGDTGGHDGGDGDTGGHDGGDEDTGGHDGGDEGT
ncbi:tripartite motif-containing protein 12A-like, partial [Dendropsophus ebraccatus]|uniref:tripartite motif-containing protein 12A-like n=1 Tax=Dendropsophus ebraccatus TaxID=150705 RepID=UPI00383143A1